MIRRTLLEWKSLPYGSGEGCIPIDAAAKIVAVAKSSSLGGKGGSRILSHGMEKLTAGQVVGVIAAEGCALEILPKIDFVDSSTGLAGIRKRLIHMLAVALDLEIDSGAITELGWQQDDLLEILIRLFSKNLANALRRGMPRRYITHEEDLPILRGGLQVTRQFTVLAGRAEKLACRYDALSSDIALNQIIKAAVSMLLRISRSGENQRLLRELAFAYSEISDVPAAALPWNQVHLDRSNASWRDLISLAKLLLAGRFQTTSGGEGKGFSLLFEMNTLFEEYVARMMGRALSGTDLTVHSQGGRLFSLEDIFTSAKAFMTKPDILIKRGNDVKLVIDTKWKPLSSRIDDPKQGVSHADVYQMMAYGRVYACSHLMLLYPHHAGLRRLDGILGQHRILGTEAFLTTATLDVSTSDNIISRLRALGATDQFAVSSCQPSAFV
jgi:5-methylcytosine-specific restriction enzyme subunit McrC